MRTLERGGLLNRELEALPHAAEVRRAARARRGADRVPELSVLMAYTKIVLADELLDSDLPDDPFLRADLFSYFPAKMRQGYRGQMEQHPLRREIIVTQVVNQLVNSAGMTYFHRLAGETGATAAELTRANFVAREIFGRRELRAGDRLVRQPARRRRADPDADRDAHPGRAGLALAGQQPPAADATPRRIVDFFEVVVEKVMAELPKLMAGRELRGLRAAPRRAGGAAVPGGPGRSGWRCCRRRTWCSASSRPPRATRSTRSRWRGCTSRSASGSGCRCWSPGSSRCRATTAGRRWPARRCATTCTPCTPSSPRRCSRPPPGRRRPGAGRGLGGARRGAGQPGASRRSRRSAPTTTADLARMSVGAAGGAGAALRRAAP